MAKSKKAGRRALAKKNESKRESIERAEETDESPAESEETRDANAAVLSDAREQPMTATEAAAVARAPTTPATRKAPGWAGIIPGLIVVGLIALAIIVQMVMS